MSSIDWEQIKADLMEQERREQDYRRGIRNYNERLINWSYWASLVVTIVTAIFLWVTENVLWYIGFGVALLIVGLTYPIFKKDYD